MMASGERGTRRRRRSPWLVAALLACSAALLPAAQETADDLTLLRGTQQRLVLERDLERVAVGDPSVLREEPLTTRELLLTGLDVGRTSLSVWYADGAFTSFRVAVEPDLSVLRAALADIHPSITVAMAPDRNALILRGLVPDLATRRVADETALAYLTAGDREAPIIIGSALEDAALEPERAEALAPLFDARDAARRRARVVDLIRVERLPALAEERLSEALALLGEHDVRVRRLVREDGPNDELDQFLIEGTVATPWALERVRRVLASVPLGSRFESRADALIDVVQIAGLEVPAVFEERLGAALERLDGVEIAVDRVLAGTAPDDERDLFVLRGSVPDQVTLMRVLHLASRLFGETADRESVRALADESGARIELGGRGTAGAQQLLGNASSGGGNQALFGGQGNLGRQLRNLVDTNLGRAKIHEAAGGRVLSFLEVRDLPQVRVTIELYEVNRNRLREIDPRLVLIGSDFDQAELLPAAGAGLVQGANAARVGAGGKEIQDVLGFLENGFSNQLQFSGGKFALDATFRVLEARGIARNLSRPSLTVLSGEPALFQVGGEVPIQSSVITPGFGSPDDAGGAANTIFNTIAFRSFGVQLAVRPLVGPEGRITLDVAPQIILPDAQLTTLLVQSTGTAQATTAFQSRSLRTSARLLDGQSLVLGGLVSNSDSRSETRTPYLSDVPILGALFTDRNRQDDELELIVVVTPTILRDPLPDVALWQFPSPSELLTARPVAREQTPPQ